jgi:hypothetical protein
VVEYFALLVTCCSIGLDDNAEDDDADDDDVEEDRLIVLAGESMGCSMPRIDPESLCHSSYEMSIEV